MVSVRKLVVVGALWALAPVVAFAQPAVPPPASASASNYVIGPGDQLQVFVWRNPDLSTTVPVRPDGRITTPLAQDVQAQGKTPSELAASLRTVLLQFVQDPIVTVVVKEFAAPNNAAVIRVIGAAATPKTVPYRAGLTALDVLVEVGGLTPYASGNRAQIIRMVNGKSTAFPLRLSDLLKSGKMKANVELMPGDIIRIPQRSF